MKTIYTRFKLSEKDSAKAFIKTRDRIGKLFFVISMIVYGVLWTIYKPEDTPIMSHYITLLLLPLMVFGLTIRAYHYFFLHNWFYVLYCTATGFLFFQIMSYFHVTYMGAGYVFFELGHLIIANLIGVGISIAVSLPFKLAYWIIFEPNQIYYDTDILVKIDEEIYPEKKAEKVEKEKQKFNFDVLNETQLQVELQNALKEERFEDAEKIKDILNTKFRT